MRRGGALLVSVSLLAGVALAGEAHWIPNRADVVRLERQVMPPGGYRLDSYDRAYSGTYVSGRKVIEGRWVEVERGRKPRVDVVSYEKLPDIADGGCSVVTVYYDLATAKIAGVRCNGLG